jgi:HK97 family phage portal protein
MSILTRIRDAFTSEPRVFPMLNTRSAALTWPTYSVGKPQWLPTDPATLAIEGYDKVVVAFACVNVIAESVSSAVLRVMKNVGTGDANPIPPAAASSPGRLAMLVNNPNPYESQPEFLEQVMKIAAVTGMAVYEKVRGPLDQVVALYPLRTDWLKPIPRNNQAYDWEYTVPGVRPPFLLKAEDVGVFRYNSSPLMGPMGTPPLMAAMKHVSIENQMTNFTQVFFQNAGVPSWIAVLREQYQDISQEDAEATAERMRQRFGGGRGAGQIGILPALERLERVSLDYNEMAFTDLSDMTAASICSAFAVPPILIHTKLGLDASTYSNYGQARRAFYEDTITPLWRRLDGAMTRALLPEFDVDETVSLEFDTSKIPALQDDLTNERAQKIELWRSQVITRNEIRSDFGYAEIEDETGAELYASASPFGMLPAGDEDDDDEVDAEPRMLGPMRMVDVPILGNDSGWRGPVRVSQDPITGAFSSRPSPNGHHPTRMQRLPPDTRAAVATTARDAYDALMRQGAPALRRFWRQQGERVIKEATSLRSMWNAAPAQFQTIFTRDVSAIDWEDEEYLLREVIEAIQQRATRRGWLSASSQGIPASAYDIANPYVQTVLGEVGTRIQGINQTTMNDVRRVVGDALDEGVTMDDLASRLKGLFTETYKGRSLAVARTESQVAYNLGATAAGKNSGVVDYAELMDNPAHDTDPGSDGLTCASRNGLIVPLDNVPMHVSAEHPNGTLAVALVVNEGG